MHELGIVIEVVKQVELFATEHQVEKIEALILQIGELSAVVPEYIKKLYPVAAEGTLLQEARLEIEMIPGNGLCQNCKKVYQLQKTKGVCPDCGSKEFELLSGKEFYIKEIICC